VDRHDCAGIHDGHLCGAEADLEASAGVSGRDRVVGLADTDPGLGVDPTRQPQRDVETCLGQRSQQRQLPVSGGADGLGSGADPTGVVAGVGCCQRLVERRE
jgi:hypothetical protein